MLHLPHLVDAGPEVSRKTSRGEFRAGHLNHRPFFSENLAPGRGKWPPARLQSADTSCPARVVSETGWGTGGCTPRRGNPCGKGKSGLGGGLQEKSASGG